MPQNKMGGKATLPKGEGSNATQKEKREQQRHPKERGGKVHSIGKRGGKQHTPRTRKKSSA